MLQEQDLVKAATNSGLDTKDFTTCLDAGGMSSIVAQDLASLGNPEQGVGVPTVFINGQKIQGVQPYTIYKAAIDDALQRPTSTA